MNVLPLRGLLNTSKGQLKDNLRQTFHFLHRKIIAPFLSIFLYARSERGFLSRRLQKHWNGTPVVLPPSVMPIAPAQNTVAKRFYRNIIMAELYTTTPGREQDGNNRTRYQHGTKRKSAMFSSSLDFKNDECG